MPLQIPNESDRDRHAASRRGNSGREAAIVDSTDLFSLFSFNASPAIGFKNETQIQI
jgi:hypothetical protein